MRAHQSKKCQKMRMQRQENRETQKMQENAGNCAHHHSHKEVESQNKLLHHKETHEESQSLLQQKNKVQDIKMHAQQVLR